jgi:uncharacterized RDD family membrane protein YckC
MKCPKCAYLGFETSDRCRNCGYDFSLSTHVEAPPELPLHHRDGGPGAPMADFDLVDLEAAEDPAGNLDLDRLIGTDDVLDTGPAPHVVERVPVAVSSPAAAHVPSRTSSPRFSDDSTETTGLPLFSPSSGHADDAPLITTPRPVRPPLSVRRTAPDVPRQRTRTPRPRRDESKLDLDLEPATHESPAIDETVAAPVVEPTAGRFARLFAVVVDLLLLGGIDGAVVYLTLAIAGLTLADLAVIPPVPMVAFLLLLNGGYLVGFTASCGQTIGKMLTGIRVVSDGGGRVDIGKAVVRACGSLLSLLTAGLAYVPALFTADARALQDRLAGTRVVRIH